MKQHIFGYYIIITIAVIIYPRFHLQTTNKEQIYTLIISNYGTDSKFKLKGWYMAIFNNTNNSYTLPLVKIPNMTENNVKVYVPPYLLGNPSLVNYLASCNG